MIVEGIVTTRNPDGTTNIAPMGPEVDAAEPWTSLVLKPFLTARTFQNLKAHGEGVFHVIDDVLLLAQAIVGEVEPALVSSQVVPVQRLTDCCRYFEFRVTNLDDSKERSRIECEIVHTGRVREFFGLNRAKHAVVEAAILVSRLGILPHEEIVAELDRLRTLIDKTGSARENQAFELLRRAVDKSVDGGTSRTARVRAPSRLHFGFFSNDRRSGRAYGGMGLMIEEPTVDVIAYADGKGEVRGASAVSTSITRRVEGLVAQLADLWNLKLPQMPAIEIVSCPAEHGGLGVGTQVSLSIAAASAQALGRETRFDDLVKLTKRGARSAIGMHGWRHGGFIVDPGEREPGVPRLPLLRQDFPKDWGVLLIRPALPAGLHGALEDRAIDTELFMPAETTQRLCQIALLEMLPAIDERNVRGFGQALATYNRLVGECFATAQGGAYAHPLLESIIQWLGARGIGAAQSSWGPATFAILESEQEATAIGAELASHFGLDRDHWLVTRAASHGALRS